MDSGLQGKRVAPGGASRGQARAIVESLASEGCDLVLWARGRDGFGGVASDLTSRYGVRTECVPQVWAIRTLHKASPLLQVTFFVPSTLLVPNAGGPPPVNPTATAPSVWRMAFQLFCITPVAPATRLLPAMPASRWGRIVAVLSSGVRHQIDDLAYSNATRSALAAWGKDGFGTRLTGLRHDQRHFARTMDTERLSLIDTMEAESRGLTQGELRALSQASISMGRYGRPEEFSAAATWRCAEPASYQTGALVNVGACLIRSI